MRTSKYAVQIGDYVVDLAEFPNNWGVRMAGSDEWLSIHNRKEAAEAQADLYIMGDKRRAKRR